MKRMVVLAGLVTLSLAASGCAQRMTQTAVVKPDLAQKPASTARANPTSDSEVARSEVIELVPVFFGFDSFVLSTDGRAALDRNAAELRRNPGVTVMIEGHCDERGTVEYNLALGERRAQAARDYLVSAGIPGARVQTLSYGKERPFDDGHDESAWARNRRAHPIVAMQPTP